MQITGYMTKTTTGLHKANDVESKHKRQENGWQQVIAVGK